MGLYENIDHLGVELHHQLGAILVKMFSSDKESLICICHNNHFYLAVLKTDFKKAKGCSIVLYDSRVNATHLTASELYDRFESQVQKVINKTGLLLELPAKNEWLLKNENCAQQRDNYNCGVYTATFAEKLIKGKEKIFKIRIAGFVVLSTYYTSSFKVVFRDFFILIRRKVKLTVDHERGSFRNLNGLH